MPNKKNAFDLLRILLAVGVLVNHGIIIGGFNLIDPLAYLSKNQTNLGEFCVMGFFTLSGYLITSSFERTTSNFLFASHRLLRIVPGFWVSLIITGFIIGPLIFLVNESNLSNYAFTGADGAFNFFQRNMFFAIRQWSIKGVLDHSAYNQSLDGSLWSLFPELECYFFTLIAGTLGLFKQNRTLILIIAINILIFFGLNFNFSKSFGPTILIYDPALKLFASYIAGNLVYVYRDYLTLDLRGTFFLSLFTLMLIKFGGYNILSPLLIAMLLINGFKFFEFKLKYDISYGIYIYSFPVEHLVHVIFKNQLSFVVFIIISFFTSALMGYFSYQLIEKPFIKLRPLTDQIINRITTFQLKGF